jgi:DNA/RNA-binding domain of Phe-tRNA-synthetase-like protein
MRQLIIDRIEALVNDAPDIQLFLDFEETDPVSFDELDELSDNDVLSVYENAIMFKG